MSKYAMRINIHNQYMAEKSTPEQGQYMFAYTVKITNIGSVAAQLISRHWIISDAGGRIQEVKGLGLVGQQPLLQPDQHFEYTSVCQLATPTGSMHGAYFCVAEDGERFEVPIPEFTLAMPHALH